MLNYEFRKQSSGDECSDVNAGYLAATCGSHLKMKPNREPHRNGRPMGPPTGPHGP